MLGIARGLTSALVGRCKRCGDDASFIFESFKDAEVGLAKFRVDWRFCFGSCCFCCFCFGSYCFRLLRFPSLPDAITEEVFELSAWGVVTRSPVAFRLLLRKQINYEM